MMGMIKLISWVGICKAAIIGILTMIAWYFGYYLATRGVDEYIREREKDIEDMTEALKVLEDAG